MLYAYLSQLLQNKTKGKVKTFCKNKLKLESWVLYVYTKYFSHCNEPKVDWVWHSWQEFLVGCVLWASFGQHWSGSVLNFVKHCAVTSQAVPLQYFHPFFKGCFVLFCFPLWVNALDGWVRVCVCDRVQKGAEIHFRNISHMSYFLTQCLKNVISWCRYLISF